MATPVLDHALRTVLGILILIIGPWGVILSLAFVASLIEKRLEGKKSGSVLRFPKGPGHPKAA